MAREDLIWDHGPNVSAGPNSADSHYEPTARQLPPHPQAATSSSSTSGPN